MWRGGGAITALATENCFYCLYPFMFLFFTFLILPFILHRIKKMQHLTFQIFFFTHSRDESRILKFRKIKKGYFMKENILH